VKRINLAATIWEHLIRPHRPGSNLVNVFSVLTFTKNLDASAILKLAAGDAHASESGEVPVDRLTGGCVRIY